MVSFRGIGFLPVRSAAILVPTLLAWALLSSCQDAEVRDPVEVGIEALELYDFDVAYKELSKVQPGMAVDTELWPKVTYALAVAAWHKSPPSQQGLQEATRLFQELAEHQGHNAIGDRARLNMGRILEVRDYIADETPDPGAAAALYEGVVERHGGMLLGDEAVLRLAEVQAQALTPEGIHAATTCLESYLQKFPESKWTPVLWQYLGDLYALYAEDAENGYAALKKAAELGLVNEAKADRTLYRIAVMADRLGKSDEAAHFYERIVGEQPRSQFGYLAAERAGQIRAASASVGANSDATPEPTSPTPVP